MAILRDGCARSVSAVRECRRISGRAGRRARACRSARELACLRQLQPGTRQDVPADAWSLRSGVAEECANALRLDSRAFQYARAVELHGAAAAVPDRTPTQAEP